MTDNRDWKIFRNRHGAPCWFQRIYEAALIVTGRHSLHRAWQRGFEEGNREEYRRLITNKAYLGEIAEASLAKAEARIAELEAALRPFAEVADIHHSGFPNEAYAKRVVTVGQLRRAEAALSSINKEPSHGT